MLEGTCHCNSVCWRLAAMPESATACNCTACRRYGALWAYGHEGEDVSVEGTTATYVRGEGLSFHFCPKCGNVTHWRGQHADERGRHRVGVNLRLTEPAPIANLPIDHFDGLDKWQDLPRDGRCIQDLWF